MGAVTRKGNGRVAGDFLFQKTIDNRDDSTLTRGKEKADEGTKKDLPQRLRGRNSETFIRCDIDFDPA